MNRIGFSQAERALIEAYASDAQSRASMAGWYAAALIPVLVFAIYGFFRKDFVAVTIAFIGLVILVWWRLSQEFSALAAHQSLFQKVLRHEQESDRVQGSVESKDSPSLGS